MNIKEMLDGAIAHPHTPSETARSVRSTPSIFNIGASARVLIHFWLLPTSKKISKADKIVKFRNWAKKALTRLCKCLED